MYATACGYLFGMFHHTIPWGLFRKHAGQISLLSQSFTSWHPNGRSLSCISLLHRGRGPAAQPFCFFALALRLKKVGHIGFLTYWECLSGCLSLSSHSFLSFLSFLFASTALRHQLWTGGLLHRSGRSSRRPGAGEKLLWLSLWPLWPLHLLSPMLGLFHGHCGAPREVHIGMA